MPIDVAGLSDRELENVIENHRRLSATEKPAYAEALAERGRRRGKGLAFKTSKAIIRRAAREGRFLSYKELADASGADWGQVHYAIGGHLWRLIKYADCKGWPMLSAIVVNKPNVTTGRMDPDTLKGFITAAKDLGYDIGDDDEAFLRDQQKKVFAWAQAEEV